MIAPVILQRGTPESWHIMPLFERRVRDFTARHTTRGDDQLPDIIHGAFGLTDQRFMMIALVEDSELLPEALKGHVVAGIETYLGRSVAMIYQFEKDESETGWMQTDSAIQAIIETWCKSIEIDEIMLMAESESRGRLFGKFGYTKGPIIMRRSLHG